MRGPVMGTSWYTQRTHTQEEAEEGTPWGLATRLRSTQGSHLVCSLSTSSGG